MYFQNKAANAVHYPRAADPILGYDSRKTTTKSLVDSAALRGSRVKMSVVQFLDSHENFPYSTHYNWDYTNVNVDYIARIRRLGVRSVSGSQQLRTTATSCRCCSVG